MKLRIGSFNVNNLFRRANVFELDMNDPVGIEVLDDIEKLTALLVKPTYGGATGQQIVALLNKYEFDPNTGKSVTNRWFFINEVRKSLFRKDNTAGTVVLTAQKRTDWEGWIELKRDVTNAEALVNTRRVIEQVAADVLCLVEVEDRPGLERFNGRLLRPAGAHFPHNLLVDGNDPRGIDVAVCSRHPIRSVRSHIDDPDPVTSPQRLFSRDCPEYEIDLPGNKILWVLGNHFKSKLGNQTTSNAKRKRQADRVRALLGRFNLDTDLVAVCGDLNDTPTSAPLAGLLGTPKLRDVLASPAHTGPRWTYKDGRQQIDYLLVSQALFNQITAVGIERRGIFSPTNFAGQFPHFAQVTNAVTQASDHAAVWADFNV